MKQCPELKKAGKFEGARCSLFETHEACSQENDPNSSETEFSFIMLFSQPPPHLFTHLLLVKGKVQLVIVIGLSGVQFKE